MLPQANQTLLTKYRNMLFAPMSKQAEKEYQSFRGPIFRTFFRFQIGLSILGVISVLIFRLAGFLAFPIVYFPGILTMLFVFGWFSSKFEYQAQAVAISCFSMCYLATTNVFAWEYQNFSHKQSFFIGSCLTAFLLSLHHYINKFEYLAFLHLLAILVKLFIARPDEPVIVGISILFDLLCLVAKFRRERQEQQLFTEFFNYREELVKFKEIIQDILPQGLLVMADINKWHFKNSFFEKKFDQEISHSEFFELFKGLEVSESKLKYGHKLLQREELLKDQRTLLEVVQEFIAQPNKRIKRFLGVYQWNNEEINDQMSFQIIMQRIFWNGQEAISIFFNDVSDQQKITALKVADKNKDKILATVSHELRTPLNVMNGLLTGIQRETKNESILKNARICKQNISLLSSLVNSILDMNLIQTGNFKLRINQMCLSELFETVQAMFGDLCSRKGLDLVLFQDKKCPKFLVSDQDRIIQILTNLVGNASKFTRKGSITVGCRAPRAEYLVKLEEDQLQSSAFKNSGIKQLPRKKRLPRCVEFFVEDTGAGIKEEDKNKLFTMYGKLQDTSATNSKGIGLGLTICQSLANQLCKGQKIQVESTYGKGTTFSFLVADLSEGNDMEFDTQNRESLQTESELPDNIDEFEDYSPQSKSLQFKGVNVKNWSFRFEEKSEVAELGETRELKNSFALNGNGSMMNESKCKSYREDQKPISKSYREEQKPKNTILAVDDNPFNLMVLCQLLSKSGLDIKQASNGEDAIEQAEKDFKNGIKYKLIFMDLQMPFMDGYEATAKLRDMMQKGEFPETPIMAFSANDAEADKKRCLDAGMVGHIPKPLNEQTLTTIIEKYCQ